MKQTKQLNILSFIDRLLSILEGLPNMVELPIKYKKIYEIDIILGYIRDDSSYKVFNCCILIGKEMLYKRKIINI